MTDASVANLIDQERRLHWARQLVVHLLEHEAQELDDMGRRRKTSLAQLTLQAGRIFEGVSQCVALGIEVEQSGLRGRSVPLVSGLLGSYVEIHGAGRDRITSDVLPATIAFASAILDRQLQSLAHLERSDLTSHSRVHTQRVVCITAVRNLISMGVRSPASDSKGARLLMLNRVLERALAQTNEPNEHDVRDAVLAETQKQ